MKQIPFLLLLFLVGFIVPSCGGSGTGNKSKEEDPAVSSDSNASFSCMLDGKKFSGSGTDQNANAAFHLKGTNEGQISFRLADLSSQGIYENYLAFRVPGKEGSTTLRVTGNDDQYGYVVKRDINYNDNPLTVTITSISPTRVSGTFSGTYTVAVSGYDAKQTIQVTDGKFDIPFSTSAMWKQANGAE